MSQVHLIILVFICSICCVFITNVTSEGTTEAVKATSGSPNVRSEGTTENVKANSGSPIPLTLPEVKPTESPTSIKPSSATEAAVKSETTAGMKLEVPPAPEANKENRSRSQNITIDDITLFSRSDFTGNSFRLTEHLEIDQCKILKGGGLEQFKRAYDVRSIRLKEGICVQLYEAENACTNSSNKDNGVFIDITPTSDRAYSLYQATWRFRGLSTNVSAALKRIECPKTISKVSLFRGVNFTGDKIDLTEVQNIGDCQDITVPKRLKRSSSASKYLQEFRTKTYSIKLSPEICISLSTKRCGLRSLHAKSPELQYKATADSLRLSNLFQGEPTLSVVKNLNSVKLIDCTSFVEIQYYMEGLEQKEIEPPSTCAAKIIMKKGVNEFEVSATWRYISRMKCSVIPPQLINETNAIFQFQILDHSDMIQWFFIDLKNPPGLIQKGILLDFDVAVIMNRYNFLDIFVEKKKSITAMDAKTIKIYGDPAKLFEFNRFLSWLKEQYPNDSFGDYTPYLNYC